MYDDITFLTEEKNYQSYIIATCTCRERTIILVHLFYTKTNAYVFVHTVKCLENSQVTSYR